VKTFLHNFDKAFENKVRLGIMSALMANEYLDFKAVKELLQITDGNLASHLKSLEAKKYITVHKEFLDRKPNTKYKATPQGRSAFEKHIKALEDLLN